MKRVLEGILVPNLVQNKGISCPKTRKEEFFVFFELPIYHTPSEPSHFRFCIPNKKYILKLIFVNSMIITSSFYYYCFLFSIFFLNIQHESKDSSFLLNWLDSSKKSHVAFGCVTNTSMIALDLEVFAKLSVLLLVRNNTSERNELTITKKNLREVEKEKYLWIRREISNCIQWK